MPISPIYYYPEKSSEGQYSRTPPGSLNVNRLISHQPPWKSGATGESIQRPKSLILADWSAYQWTDAKLVEVQTTLNQLMAEGFAIYIWQFGEIIQLRQDTLASLNDKRVRNTITAAFPAEIMAAVTNASLDGNASLEPHKIHILDDYGLECLLAKDETTVSRRFSHIELLDYQRKIFDILKQANPPLTEIILTKFATKYNQYIEKLRQLFPDVPINNNWRSLELNGSELQTLLNKNTITCINEGFKGADPAEIKKLFLVNDWHSLETLLNKNTVTYINGEFKRADLAEIKKLFLVKVNTNSQELQQLLSAISELETLEFSNCVDVDMPTAGTFSLPCLQTFQIRKSDISVETIQQILKQTAQLKHLYFHDYNNLNGLDFTEVVLENLELLNIKSNKLTIKSLQNLLAKTIRLNTLTLGEINNLQELNWETINLSSLENLILNEVVLSANNLQHISRQAICLKTLNLRECNLSQIMEGKYHLSALEVLVLNETSISFQGLERLLATATQLKKLYLRDIAFTQSIPANFNLAACETLDLSGTQIDVANLRRLLANAKNLKEIDTYTNSSMGIPLTTFLDDSLDLPFLESIIVDDPVTPEIFQKLRAKFPRLKKINSSTVEYYLQNKPDQSLSVVSQNFSPLSDVAHDPKRFINFKPTAEDVSVEFKGINKTVNQGMVIEKLSQYLTLSQQHLAIIPKLQDGICKALVTYFLTKSPFEWDALIARINAWDGRDNTLNAPLKADFEELFDYVQRYQLHEQSNSTYLGDNLLSLLKNHRQDMILSNPWHAIGLKYTAQNTWIVYDPNFIYGPIEVSWQNLLPTLEQSLGQLISIEGNYQIQPAIKDPQAFLAEGGLLVLCVACNAHDMLKLLPPAQDFNIDALHGLLMRNTDGIPAWIAGIQTPVTAAFTFSLLQQFVLKHPKDHLTLLKTSLDALTPMQRQSTLESLRTPSAGMSLADKALIDKLCMSIRVYSNQDYEKILETWRKTPVPVDSMPLYCQQRVAIDDQKKQLIELESTPGVLAMQVALQKHCLSISRPVYCIDSPEDLVCSAPFIKRNGDIGVTTRGPGGPLHDFLTKHHDKSNPPILLVNYERFNADDIVRFNSLLDEKRFADGTPLSEHAKVIGLINRNKPNRYQGEDFYSRLDKVKNCPLSDAIVRLALAKLPNDPDPATIPVTINLAHADDWQERLLGRWLIKKDVLQFEEGELPKALAKGAPIELQNALWNDASFQAFWQHAIASGEIHYANQVIKVPENLQWFKRDGYDWQALIPVISFTSELKPGALVLNPKLLTNFFYQYHFDNNEHTLDTVDGLLKENAGKTLDVNLTRHLNEDEWGLLLLACKKHNIQLVCHVAPEVDIPLKLYNQAKASSAPSYGTWDGKADSNLQVIASSDIATTVDKLTQQDSSWQVIDVSECYASDLLVATEGTFNEDTLKFWFNQTDSLVTSALKAGKKIILKGRFSEELIDNLAPLLLEPIKNGQLVLVTDTPSPFNYCHVVRHEVSLADKEASLKATDAELVILKPYLEQESLSKLQARLAFHRLHPEQNTDNAWQGLGHAVVNFKLAEFDELNYAEKAHLFNQNRLDAVNAILAKQPYVLLTGPTGVGKSTFVEKYLGKQPGVTLYQGELRLQEWALDKTPGKKILFIDEANISPRQWSEFEGLFNNPPGIRIGNHYHTLSPDHQVVFAGNPLSYGGERQLAPLFKHHGNAILFEPLPLECIYEDILKPIFAASTLEKDALTLCKPMLDVYRFIAEFTRDEVFISARELQMMALAVAALKPPADYLLAARHYAYTLGKDLVPLNKHAEFKQQFKALMPLSYTAPTMMGQFLVTESRFALQQQLNDLLTLRLFKSAPTSINDAQKYGGLAGIVIEGEPAAGKSEEVTATLLAQGFSEGDVNRDDNAPNSFYRLPVSMGFDEKKRILLKAFDEGAVVIIDEINSSPMMERLMNDLLMGKTPEGARPTNPGFLIIGTQNPPTAGRIKPSNAMNRRLLKVTLPKDPCYPPEEMVAILNSKGVEPDTAQEMVAIYLNKAAEAKQKHLTPAPTFRDLLRLAKQHINAEKKQNRPIIDEQSARQLLISIKEHITLKNWQSFTFLDKRLPIKVVDSSGSTFEKMLPPPIKNQLEIIENALNGKETCIAALAKTIYIAQKTIPKDPIEKSFYELFAGGKEILHRHFPPKEEIFVSGSVIKP